MPVKYNTTFGKSDTVIVKFLVFDIDGRTILHWFILIKAFSPKLLLSSSAFQIRQSQKASENAHDPAKGLCSEEGSVEGGNTIVGDMKERRRGRREVWMSSRREGGVSGSLPSGIVSMSGLLERGWGAPTLQMRERERAKAKLQSLSAGEITGLCSSDINMSPWN